MSKLIIATVAAFFAVEAKAETAISCKPAWDANNYLKQAAEKGFPGVVVSDTEGLKVTYFAEPRKGAITKFISASYDKETETFRCNYEDAVGNSYY